MPHGQRKARDALRLLVADGYTGEQILTVLGWMWAEDHKDARFWRKQVAFIAAVRKGPDSKFARIFMTHKDAMQGKAESKMPVVKMAMAPFWRPAVRR